MDSLISELPYAIMIAGSIGVGLWISNIVFDLKVPHYISRKIGHSAGGLAFLSSAFLFSSAWWPIILSSIFGVILLASRYLKPDVFRGVGGSGRNRASFSEVWFAWVAVPVYALGWLWLRQPLVAVSCLLFMAWGDCLTGIVRSQFYTDAGKGMLGSLAMLGLCLVVSWAFIKPFWIGAVGSVVAVVAEWAFGDLGVLKWADDNWAIPLLSLGTVLGLMAFAGYL